MALRLLVNHRPDSVRGSTCPGVLAASTGLFALVYGFSNAETHSWSAPLTIVSAVRERRAAGDVRRDRASGRASRCCRCSIVRDRARGGAYISIALAGSGPFAVFLFLTFYLQRNLGFSPLMTGLAFLPLTAAIVRHRHHRADAASCRARAPSRW